MKGNLWNVGISVLDFLKYWVIFYYFLVLELKLVILFESLKMDIVVR